MSTNPSAQPQPHIIQTLWVAVTTVHTPPFRSFSACTAPRPLAPSLMQVLYVPPVWFHSTQVLAIDDVIALCGIGAAWFDWNSPMSRPLLAQS
jgi:hypothetical protein